MNILLVNDDNIHAKGIRYLATHLSKAHNVTVVAPKEEMSGVSHAFTIFSPLFVETVDLGSSIDAYAVSGTPSDCVKIGIRKLCAVIPDLIISGLNCGENSGISAFYSGTVAGAREGALFGIRSIAVSTSNYSDDMYVYAVKWLDNFLAKLSYKEFDFEGDRTFLNVNFPYCHPDKILGTRLTQQGITPFRDDYEKRTSPSGKHYFWLHGDKPASANSLDDETALTQGYVTITPLTLDMTDNNFLENYNGILNL
jgi:5'-nucleotidase